MLTELVADQVAPAYWVPNKDVEVRIDRLGKKIKTYAFCLFIRAVLPASCYSVRIFPNIIVEVVRKMFSFTSTSLSLSLLGCGRVFCDTCSKYRAIVSWVDPDKPVRVCKECHDHPKSRPPSSASLAPSERDRQMVQRNKPAGNESGSSGGSTSTVSSGEHLSDLCLTPNDIFDIDQPRAGTGKGKVLFYVCSFLSFN